MTKIRCNLIRMPSNLRLIIVNAAFHPARRDSMRYEHEKAPVQATGAFFHDYPV
ncbi:hypothetical protein [Paenibacillus sp. GbtcB18]|uniref:hypothetical protein n=1 Tax=Paenibacillus sp. GbtcB18 TaxID=2824763 RepID=UPI001C2FAB49|nr:hypothetical protein [Paenibacillus sp. GbtcB18]